MRYLLDTNTCIELIRKRSPHVITNLTRHQITDIAVSTILLHRLSPID